MNYATQIEILKRIEELYSEIFRITSLLDIEQDDHEKILIRRQELLNEIISLQERQKTLPLGAEPQQISECEKKIKALILSIMSDSALILEASRFLQESIKKELSKITTARRAAKGYAANMS
jgi:hypothetical protein